MRTARAGHLVVACLGALEVDERLQFLQNPEHMRPTDDLIPLFVISPSPTTDEDVFTTWVYYWGQRVFIPVEYGD